jgi:hypothetical protein
MAGGSPLADAWRSMDDQKRLGAQDLLADEYKKAQIAHLQQGPRPTGFTAELIAAGIDPSSEQGKAYLLKKVESTVDPYVTFSDANRGSYFGPRSGLPGALGVAPPPDSPLGAPELDTGTMLPDDAAGLFPGARMSSGYRTPQRNAQVGGVSNSMHTRGKGQAVDLVPGRGQSIASLAEQARKSGRFTEVLPEKDHLHVGWGKKNGPAPTNREQLVREANAAIAKGADPVKVQARLRQMGVQ